VVPRLCRTHAERAAVRQHDRIRRDAILYGDGVRSHGLCMVIWLVSAPRAANKAQAELYAAIARDGGTHKVVDRMQTRAELYATG
jgi:2-methylisocitrate lyase-like PEP mutase family enzyme